MKKKIIMVLCVVCSLVCTGSIYANSSDSVHKHEYIVSNGCVEASCTQAGYSYEKCVVCGDVREHYQPKKDHNYVVSAGSTDGNDTYEKCCVCGKIKK